MFDSSTNTLPSMLSYPKWNRFSTAQRMLRYLLGILIAAALIQSARTVDIIPEFLLDAPSQMADMIERMWPPDWRHYPKSVHHALVETLHIATLGTLLSIFLAIPFALLVATSVTRSRTLNFFSRVVLVATRSVNSLVWALLFVAIFGPGPLAGTLAIAFRSIGFVGKLLGEALDDVPKGPVEALKATGASTMDQLLFAYWPRIKPAFWSVVLLRWDINVRESAVLGIVGAGGIGMVLDTALNLFQWQRVAIVLLSILTIVLIAEVVVAKIRQRVM
jgi:phosphonate transport system permease protein